jgi:hypothetical protein
MEAQMIIHNIKMTALIFNNLKTLLSIRAGTVHIADKATAMGVEIIRSATATNEECIPFLNIQTA